MNRPRAVASVRGRIALAIFSIIGTVSCVFRLLLVVFNFHTFISFRKPYRRKWATSRALLSGQWNVFTKQWKTVFKSTLSHVECGRYELSSLGNWKPLIDIGIWYVLHEHNGTVLSFNSVIVYLIWRKGSLTLMQTIRNYNEYLRLWVP